MQEFTPREEMERSARTFFGLVMLLLAVGLVMVYSAAAVRSARAGNPESNLLVTQLVKTGVGLAGMLAMMRVDYRVLARHTGKIFCAMLVLLLLVLIPIPGFSGAVNGASRWFRIGGFMIQPSEFAKLGLVIVVAGLIVRAGDRIESFVRGFLPPVIATLAICVLILVEPDFGTCALTGFLIVLLLVIGGARILHFAVATAVSAPLLVLFAFHNMEHVRLRILAFLSPAESGQVADGLTALASGGLFGSGLGAGVFKLYFLPMCESDFIYSVIGEELGFVGGAGVLLLFALLAYHGLKVLLGVKNRFGFIIGTGVLLLISTQALANIAVVLGMAPAKGIALPFISSGGSSLLALMMGVGIFMRVAREPDLPAPRFEETPVPAAIRGCVDRLIAVTRRGEDND